MPRNLSAVATATPLSGGRPFGSRQAFTANGTFVPPTGISTVWVTMIGGGGGGGGGQWVNDGVLPAQYAAGGGSGGAGEAIYRVPVSVTPGTGVSVVVGAAGAAGSNQTTNAADGSGNFLTNTAVAGGNGGSSSFGAVSVAGGTGGGRTNVQSGGTGGTAGSGGTSATAIQTITRLYADHATVNLEPRWGTRYRGGSGVAGPSNVTVNLSPPLASGWTFAVASFFEIRFTTLTTNNDWVDSAAQPTANGSSGSGGLYTQAGSFVAPRAGIAGLVIVEW